MVLTQHALAERLPFVWGCSKNDPVQLIDAPITSGEAFPVSGFGQVRVINQAICRTRGLGHRKTAGFKCSCKFSNQINA